MHMTYEDLNKELEKIRMVGMGIKIYNLFADFILFTPKRIITTQMKDLMIKSFAIASIPNITNRDLNYIKNELIIAGWFVEREKSGLSK